MPSRVPANKISTSRDKIVDAVQDRLIILNYSDTFVDSTFRPTNTTKQKYLAEIFTKNSRTINYSSS